MHTEDRAYLPLCMDVRQRPCLVVGGGAVAARKIAALLRAGAAVRVQAPRLCAELATLRARSEIIHERCTFDPARLADYELVIAATDDKAVNRLVAAAVRAARRPINVVDDPEHGNLIFPAIVRRGSVVVAISSGGSAPVLARQIRAWLETMLPRALGPLANLAGRMRGEVARVLRDSSSRRRFWEAVLSFDGPVFSALAADRPAQAEARFRAALGAGAPPRSEGFVSLVGAGPGDPGLLTLHALRALQQADVVLHDRLVSPETLDLARRDAKLEYVGKAAGGVVVAQSEINVRMIELASSGLRVVRLKGGDPGVFGRGGEEIDALRKAGIAYEVVPGITAALAAAAYSGIALSRRGVARQITFVTAHGEREWAAIDWPSLAGSATTVAFYMGAGRTPLIERQLLTHGRAADTPIVIVERATQATQRIVYGRLGALASRAAQARVTAPAIIIVGETAAEASANHWFGEMTVNCGVDLAA